jgi:nucleoside 2-deoxyribosyltransferase
MENRRIYLAGPDVFFPDVAERSENLKIQCDLVGLEGVFPLDTELKLEEAITEEAKVRNGCLIYRGNIELIKSSAAVLANISPFRGPSIDCGTAFEIGFAKSLGKIVVAYTDQNAIYKDRVIPDGLRIEDFGMVDNLMIHSAVDGKIFNSSAKAIQYLASQLSINVN